jgi:hypothetical protein
MQVLLWQEGEVKVELIAGDLTVTYGGKGATAVLKIDGGYLLDNLEEAIPGDWDKALIAMAKSAIGK